MNIFYQKQYWDELASKEIHFVAKDLHNSWNPDTSSYTEHSAIPDRFLPPGRGRVLDFGIGMGRNYDYLSSIFSEVSGYDTPGMVDNLKTMRPEINATSDWSQVMRNKYDLIYDCTCMQHMPPQDLIHKAYCASFISPYFVQLTRSFNDFIYDYQRRKGGVNMFSLIKSLQCYDVVDIEIDNADAINDETHYFVLYKSRNFSI